MKGCVKNTTERKPPFPWLGKLVRSIAVLLCIACLGVVILWSFPMQAHAQALSPSIVHRPSIAMASCSGIRCNGTNPYSTGCAGTGTSYWVVDSVPVIIGGRNYGWTQLWYSGTCGTNWARYACSTQCAGGYLYLQTCQGNTYYAVQGPLIVFKTALSGQIYLPTTKARAELDVLGGVTGAYMVATGCY